jgi:hypothetical protein
MPSRIAALLNNSLVSLVVFSSMRASFTASVPTEWRKPMFLIRHPTLIGWNISHKKQ